MGVLFGSAVAHTYQKTGQAEPPPPPPSRQSFGQNVGSFKQGIHLVLVTGFSGSCIFTSLLKYYLKCYFLA